MLQNVLFFLKIIHISYSTDFGMGFNFNYQNYLLDPSSFSPAIHKCQETCADNYFSCSFISCSETSLDKGQGYIGVDPECCWNVKPSFMSRFLYFLTLGFLGQSTARQECLEECQYFDIAENVWQDRFEKIDNTYFKCLDNCTEEFRKCYKECICTERPKVEACKTPEILYILPQVQPEVMFGFNGEMIPPEQAQLYVKDKSLIVTKKTYEFDWSKIE